MAPAQSPRDENFGIRVRYYMERAGLGTGALARRMGVSDGAVSKWRKGYPPAGYRLEKLAFELGISLERLMPPNLTDEDRAREKIELELIRSGERGDELLMLLYEVGIDQAVLTLRGLRTEKPRPKK